MDRNLNSYYSYRIKLEKLEQKTWLLIVLARLLLLLILFISNYKGR